MPIKWGAEQEAKLLTLLLTTHDIKIDYGSIAEAWGPDVTPMALMKHVGKIKSDASPSSQSNAEGDVKPPSDHSTANLQITPKTRSPTKEPEIARRSASQTKETAETRSEHKPKPLSEKKDPETPSRDKEGQQKISSSPPLPVFKSSPDDDHIELPPFDPKKARANIVYNIDDSDSEHDPVSDEEEGSPSGTVKNRPGKLLRGTSKDYIPPRRPFDWSRPKPALSERLEKKRKALLAEFQNYKSKDKSDSADVPKTARRSADEEEAAPLLGGDQSSSQSSGLFVTDGQDKTKQHGEKDGDKMDLSDSDDSLFNDPDETLWKV